MDFHEAAEEVRSVEKYAEEKKPYSGKVELPKTIDFSPEEFVDKAYVDMLNDYERLIKIAKISGREITPVNAPIAREAKPEAKLKMHVTGVQEMKMAAPAGKPEAKAAPATKTGAPIVQRPGSPAAGEPAAPVFQVESKPAAPQAPKKELGFLKDFSFEADFSSKAKPREAEKEGEAEKRIARLISAQKEEPKGEGKPVGFEIPQQKPPVIEKKAAPIAIPLQKPAAKKAEEAPEIRPEFEFEREPAAKKKEEKMEFEAPRAMEERAPEPEPEQVEAKEGIPEPAPEPVQEQPEEIFRKEEPRPQKGALTRETKEIMGEVSGIPYLEKHEHVSLVIPPLLSIPPEQAAEKRYAEIEGTVPLHLEKGSAADMKKRMFELTRQLFKEKSINRRKQINEEIATLRQNLSAKEEAPRRAVSYATGFLSAMEVDQKAELATAKDNLTRQYHEQLAKIMDSFSSSLRIARSDEERKAIYDTFVSDLENLRVQFETLSDKYEAFFLREHSLALEKLRSVASLKNDKYVVDKIDERMKEAKFSYSADFLSLEDAIRKEISSLISSKRHEALESYVSKEMETVLSIVNMKEDELIKYIHSHHPEKYKEFEGNKVTKIELLASARVFMAADAGLKKDIVNKYFG